MRRKIGIKMIVLVTVVITLMMTIIGFRVVLSEKDTLTQALINKGESVTKFLAKVAPAPIAAFDVSTLDQYTAQLIQDPEILYAVILSEEGIGLSTAVDQKELQGMEGGSIVEFVARLDQRDNLIKLEQPIIYDGSRIGIVKVGLTTFWLGKKIKKQISMIAGMSLIGTVIAISLIALYISKGVVRPLTQDVQLAIAVASGDMTQKVRVNSDDELGILGNALNMMVDDLNGIVVKIHNALNSMSATSEKLSSTSKKLVEGADVQSEATGITYSSTAGMASSIKQSNQLVDTLHAISDDTSSAILEMTASVEEVSNTLQTLTGAVNTTTSSINEMSAELKNTAANIDDLSASAEQTATFANNANAITKQVQEKAKEATQLSEVVRQNATETGMEAVQNTIEQMTQIRGDFKNSSDVISDLNEKSVKIGTILRVINDVTGRTNLLALNAAIIAAQAGEHGKGFAVVAEEIKELSDRTASSTKEIGQIIESIKVGINNATESMEKGTQSVEKGVKASNDASAALSKIVESASRSSQTASEIEQAMAKQATGMKQLDDAVQRITMTLRQIANATKEQEKAAELISKAVESMRSTANEVNQATVEQMKGSRQINQGVEKVLQSVEEVSRTTKDQQRSSDQIIGSIERIQTITKENRSFSSEMNQVIAELLNEAKALREEVNRFRI